MSKIYNIKWDFDISGDSERIAYHIPFENSDKASIIFLSTRYKDKIPSKIFFQANFNLIPKIDYPSTDLDIPIVSDKIINLLQSIGDFDAIFTECIMVDDTFLEDIFESKGMIKKEIITNSCYKALSIINQENCFDFDNSVFKPSDLNPNIPGYVEKLVLKKDYKFPPIFRVKESPSKLLITEQSKNIFEKNNIQGCVFDEIATN